MYGSVAEVSSAFDPSLWDPAQHTPNTATVTVWLDAWSDVLDGEIGHVVSVPVSPSASPKLHAVCARVTVMRVQADVVAYHDQDEPAQRRVESLRKQAAELVDGIRGGAVGDGAALGGRTPDRTGAPSGGFGDGQPSFTRDQQF